MNGLSDARKMILGRDGSLELFGSALEKDWEYAATFAGLADTYLSTPAGSKKRSSHAGRQ